jgi:hypothetical protein
MLSNEQKEWFEQQTIAFLNCLGEESIKKGVEEADYYTEGLKIVQKALDREKKDFVR